MMNEPEIVECGNCKSHAFTEIVTFAKVSAVLSQTGKAGIAPIGSTYICMNCGTNIEETEAVKSLTEETSSIIM